MIKTKLWKIRNAIYLFGYCRLNRNRPESVYFYTLHKCASSLFSKFVLKNVVGLWNIDYASEVFRGRRSIKKKPTFLKQGIIYGPIRLSSDRQAPVGEYLVGTTTNHHFLKGNTSIILIRDPRDILISSYYSFGFTHKLSKVGEISKMQQAKREHIQSLTLDEYVIEAAANQIEHFRLVQEVVTHSERSVILRYEDLIDDFDTFAKQLSKYLNFEPATIEEIYKRSRPKDVEDTESHRRSGATGGFRSKLKEDTVRALNEQLKDVLNLYGYEE